MTDVPIDGHSDDEFERGSLAERLAVEAASAPAAGGYVIGLCGRWGSGKTSVARMAIESLEANDVMVMRFNPWMFSGHDDLVLRFFAELTATMGRDGSTRFQAVARRFAAYAEVVAGVARYVPGGQAASELITLAGSFGKAASGDVKTVDSIYQELADALTDLPKRIVVFVDDIDRLTDSEIRDVVRLVKSVGDLPNVTYVLAFDRLHVESVLGSDVADEYGRPQGRAYLEKIVQSRYDVPRPRREVLIHRYLPRQLSRPLQAAAVNDPSVFLGPLSRSLSELVNTPRDVNRIANAFTGAIAIHGGEIAAVDLVGLEALRMLEPDVHARLDSIADILLGEDWHTTFTDGEADARKARLGRLNSVLARASAPDATRLLLQQLFPAGRKDLGDGRAQKDGHQEDRENRVTVSRIFWRYVHATIPETEVSSAEVEEVAATLQRPRDFARLVARYHGERLADMLSRLAGYWDGFDPDVVVPLGQELLIVGTRLPSDDSPFRLALGPATWQFERLLGQLLISEPDSRRRAENLRRLVRRAPNLSARMRLIVWFGAFPQRPQRDREREILSENQTKMEMNALRGEVLAAPAATLAAEIETSLLLREVLLGDRERAQRELALKARDPDFFLVLLRESTVAVRHGVEWQYVFNWRQFAATLGEDAARTSVMAFSKHVRSDDYDTETREGLRQAVAIARGDAEPSTMFDRPDGDDPADY